jgi:hypothetical protein
MNLSIFLSPIENVFHSYKVGEEEGYLVITDIPTKITFGPLIVEIGIATPKAGFCLC